MCCNGGRKVLFQEVFIEDEKGCCWGFMVVFEIWEFLL